MKGTAWKFGNDIDTDIIVPGRYLIYTDEERLSEHCMEGLDADFNKKCKKGDFIVAGTNFGCGSSREHAPIALKAAGIQAVVAKSFARIFYRNATNIGLPLVEAPNGPDEIDEEDIVKLNLEEGTMENISKNKEYKTTKLPPFMFEILENGGLIDYLNNTEFKE